MKMSIVRILALIWSISSVVALAADRSGPFVSVAVGARSTNVNTTLSAFGTALTIDAGKSFLVGDLSAGWLFDMGRFSIAAGAFYQPGSSSLTAYSQTFGATTFDITFREKNRYGVLVEPGFAVGPDTTVYAKLVYSQARGEIDITGLPTTAEDIRGPGGGAGIRHFINGSPKLYVFADAEYTRFSSQTSTLAGTPTTLTFEPRNFTGLMGIGFKF